VKISNSLDVLAEPLALGLGLGVVAIGAGPGEVVESTGAGVVVADGMGVDGDAPGFASF
jgi:hypothetical protein